MLCSPMTFEEFKEQAARLHRRFPTIYSYKNQVSLAFHVSGMPLEWFKTRVDYVVKSGNKDYDWVNSVRSASQMQREKLRGELWIEALVAHHKPTREEEELVRLAGTMGKIAGERSLQELLAAHGVSSAAELIEKTKGTSND